MTTLDLKPVSQFTLRVLIKNGEVIKMLWFKNRKKFTLVSPSDGEIRPLKSIPDVIYASSVYGVGFAVEPTSDVIVSPVDGTVTSYFPTKHAVGITADKLQVLIHMGIDTVDLNGNPFETLVKVGDHVSVNTPISIMDRAAIKRAGKATTTMVVVVNAHQAVKDLHVPVMGVVTAGEPVGAVLEN